MRTTFPIYEKRISYEHKYFPRSFILRIEQKLLENGSSEFDFSVHKKEGGELVEILQVTHTDLEELLDVIIKNLRINNTDKEAILEEIQWVREKSSNWKRMIF